MRSASPVFVAAALLCACGDAPSSVTVADADTDQGRAQGDDEGDEVDAGQLPTSEGPLCESFRVAVRPEDPEILIVLDRSGSMAGEPWDQAILALDDLIGSFPQYRFGLSMYPAVGEELDCNAGKMDVTPELETKDAIHSALFSFEAQVEVDIGYTPTAKTLRAAEPYLTLQLDSYQERFVLLVTDGQPNCNAAGPASYTPDLDATLLALADLAKQNVKTFVFGYRTQAIDTVMDQMAAAGGTGSHLAVEDPATILAAFEAIGDALAPCNFALDAPAPGAEFVRVTLDGKELELAPDGFTLVGDANVVLGGASCEAVRDGGTHRVEVEVECEPVRVL